MNATRPPLGARDGARPASGSDSASGTSVKWAALGEAGGVVAVLAGLSPERPGSQMRNFPALIRDADPWRRERADAGIDDLTAIMEPGLAALLAVRARGADPRPAALALLNEFNAARGAILALLPPTGALGPRRTA